jgi:Tol biopolymer transport system component
LSTDPAISGNGRYVAFTSSATNLVRISGMSAPVQNVFLRDLQAGTTVLASANSSNTGSGNRASYSPAISVDGRYVLFRSLATNLASGSFSTGYENLFLRDMQLGTNYVLTQTTRVRPLGDMTPDGRFVAFYGTVSGNSTNLCVWDSQAARLVFTNAAPYFGVGNIAISPDGNRFAYTTASLSTLTAIDRVTGTNWAIGNLAGGPHPGPRFSGDGRFLVYVTTVNRTNQVYLYDLQYVTNFVVSHACNSSAAAYGASDWPAISSDGRFVAYRSSAGNIVIGDTNGLPDVFLYDRLNSATTLVSVNRFGTGAGDNRSLAPVFSGDGQTLVFQSWASDLVAQDFNCTSDLFACGLYASGEIPLFSVQIMRSAGTGQGPWLMWPVVPGKNYSVQFKSGLRDADWQTLNEGVTVLGNQAYLNDLSAGPGPRFYRVVAY